MLQALAICVEAIGFLLAFMSYPDGCYRLATSLTNREFTLWITTAIHLDTPDEEDLPPIFLFLGIGRRGTATHVRNKRCYNMGAIRIDRTENKPVSVLTELINKRLPFCQRRRR